MGWMIDGTGKFSCSKCGQMSANNWADCGQCKLIETQEELVKLQRDANQGNAAEVRYVRSAASDPSYIMAIIFAILSYLQYPYLMNNPFVWFTFLFTCCGTLACLTG